MTPKIPRADLGPMFTQVVGTLLTLARENENAWRPVHGIERGPGRRRDLTGRARGVNANLRELRREVPCGATEQEQAWNEILSAHVRRPSDAKSLGNAARSATGLGEGGRRDARHQERDDTETLARALLPLYSVRVAVAHRRGTRLDQAGAETRRRGRAAAFEKRSRHLAGQAAGASA